MSAPHGIELTLPTHRRHSPADLNRHKAVIEPCSFASAVRSDRRALRENSLGEDLEATSHVTMTVQPAHLDAA